MKFERKSNINLKSEKKEKGDLDESIGALDGGYAWIVAIFCGFHIMTVFPCYQFYGIIYQKRLLNYGISKFEIATIFNIHVSISSITSLLSAPVFKRYSIRKIAFAGIFLSVLGIFLSSFANNFPIFLVSYSLLYGAGRGICTSSVLVISNLYFKKKRMQAAGYTWSITAAGNVIMPYIAYILQDYYGYQGMVWLFSGLALQSCVFAITYQPVKNHKKKSSLKKQEETVTDDKQISKLDIYSKKEKNNVFSNQAFVVDPKDDATIIYNQGNKFHTFPRASKTEIQKVHKVQSETDITSYKNENNPACFRTEQNVENPHEENSLKWYNRNKMFDMFGLDLLADPIFVSLLVGVNLAYFSEQNFMGLTPFILVDFGFNNSEVSLVMALMGVADVIFRSIIPYVVQYLQWGPQFSFIVSILILVMGRIVFSFNPSLHITILAFFIMGTGRALHVLYFVQILPMYVSIKKLPAAVGLQFLGCALVTAILGPLTGKLQNSISYAVMINVLNLISMITGITWSIYLIYVKYKNKS